MKLKRTVELLGLVAIAVLIVATLNQSEDQGEQSERFVLVKIYDAVDHKMVDELYNDPVQKFLEENEIGHTFSSPGILVNSNNKVEYIELRVALIDSQQNLPRLRRFVHGIAANKRIVIE